MDPCAKYINGRTLGHMRIRRGGEHTHYCFNPPPPSLFFSVADENLLFN